MTPERDPIVTVLEVVGRALRDREVQASMFESSSAEAWRSYYASREANESARKALAELVAEVEQLKEFHPERSFLWAKVSAAKAVLR